MGSDRWVEEFLEKLKAQALVAGDAINFDDYMEDDHHHRQQEEEVLDQQQGNASYTFAQACN
jgi:hypothetical protein